MSKRRQGVQIQYSTMSAQTKQFLQKICYKETASVDMTRYGFVNDSHPVRLFIKPLRNQLEKIHGKNQMTKLRIRRDKSIDAKRQTMPFSPLQDTQNQMNETLPKFDQIEGSIDYLISQQKEQKRQNNNKIVEIMAKENSRTIKRNRTSSKQKKTD